MILTTAQKTALKTNIAANTATVSIDYHDGRGLLTDQIKNWKPADDGLIAQVIADWYNLFPTVDFFGNYKTVPLSVIKAAIKHKNYTPTDSSPVSGATVQVSNDLLLFANRAHIASAFQMAVNNLLIADTTFDATNANLVSSLKDATNSNMPTGVAGAALTGGWLGANGVQTVICRKGTNLEKVLADLTNGTGADNTHAATFTAEGEIDGLTLADAVRTG